MKHRAPSLTVSEGAHSPSHLGASRAEQSERDNGGTSQSHVAQHENRSEAPFFTWNHARLRLSLRIVHSKARLHTITPAPRKKGITERTPCTAPHYASITALRQPPLAHAKGSPIPRATLQKKKARIVQTNWVYSIRRRERNADSDVPEARKSLSFGCPRPVVEKMSRVVGESVMIQ